MARRVLLVIALLAASHAIPSEPAYQLVFGSFSNPDNAQRFAGQVAAQLNLEIQVQPVMTGTAATYRVATAPLAGQALQEAIHDARAHDIEFWRFAAADVAAAPAAEGPPQLTAAPAEVGAPPQTIPAAPAGPVESAVPTSARTDNATLDVDLGMQTRSFVDRGLDDQKRFDPSVSLTARYYRSFAAGRYNVQITPFGRFDEDDDNRTHADLREFYVSRVGDNWDLYVGFRQVFWGVTEFNHLIDIINQTDLVEDIDGETKLGQPMINLSLVRTWGIVDFFVMPAFRERTFPGRDGRLRYVVPVDEHEATYESGDEEHHVDLAARWAHNLGLIEFGIYQFRGTSRAPLLIPFTRPNGDLALAPYYGIINQTGLDAQAIVADWAFKLEALSRSGQQKRYAAATGGFERTLVGVLGTRWDLGLVLEYVWDQRDDEADSIYDHDVGVATRWRLNDVADTTALLGMMWDVRNSQYFVNLEANRRLGDHWALAVKGRAFGGTQTPEVDTPAEQLQVLADDEHKLDQLARDDYIQLELIRYF
jgi:hypothetical protein